MKQTTIICLAIFLVAAGCATLEVQVKQEASTGILPGEAVTIILTEKFLAGWGSGFRGGDEGKVAKCVGGAMRKINPTLQLISSREFRDSLFPWFEHVTAPDNMAELESLLNKPLVQNRIATLGLRYVIALTGETTESVHKGGWGLFGLAGWFGYEWWDQKSKLLAAVWDLKQVRSSGRVDVSASGRSSIAAFIFPIYNDALTELTACKGLGEQLVRFLSGHAQP